MQFKGTLIVVEDCHKAFCFYESLFDFELIHDNEGNMELSGGLYLQERKYWEEFIGRQAWPRHCASELYFETPDIHGFIEKLERLYPCIQYVQRLTTHSWGQQVIRFFDLDGNLIEVGTPFNA